jgi:hypothetical protein
MQAKAGTRLRSAVCTTEVIVVRSPATDLDLRCGGVALLLPDEVAPDGATMHPDLAAGSPVGKRYADDEAGVELLVVKAGDGSLSIGDVALPLKGAKALPSSD